MKHKSNNIDRGILTELIGYHVRLAQLAIFKDFVATLSEYEMTPTHFGTLVIVNNNPGIKQTDLAGAIQIDRSTVVPLIDKLESEGLVTRERLTNDRRTNALRITENGRLFLDRLLPLVRAHEQKFFKNLTKDEQIRIIQLLNKIY